SSDYYGNTAYFDVVYQILDETFIEGATYTLSVWVGNPRPEQGNADDWALYFTGEDYTINLAEAHGLALLPDWELISLEYTATAADAGKRIGIKMSGAEGETYVAFDDVTLSYVEPAPTVPFSLGPVEDIELGNDAQLGPDGNSNGSGTGARDIEVRRRVFLISYDISSLKGRENLGKVSFNLVSHNIHGETNVYGVVEDMDLLEVESLTWNTAPGVQNDPTPELAAPVALDMDDLTNVLLSFAGPGETLVRFSTDTSAALADFINSDTDGILTFLFAPAADGNQLIVRSREQALGGTLLEGVIAALANIILVTEAHDIDEDGVQDDQGFIDLLRGAGYAVDVQLDRWKQLEGQDANDANDYVAELNAADLVIVSRSSNSGNYDDGNEPTLWNGVTSPLLQMSAYLPRSSRWRWIDSTSISNQEAPIMIVVDANHPVLAGVEVDPDGLVFPLDGSVGSGMTSFLATADAGNGSVIATTLGGDIWVAEWAAGAEFYEGSGQVAGGHRMVFFAGTQEVGVTPWGGMNLTAAGIQMYLNAVAYMIPDPPAALTATLTGTAAGTDSSATGMAVFQPNADGTAISYVLSVTGLENATMAHIHVSDEPGANGGVAVWLYPAGPPPTLIPGSFTGVLGEGEITADSLAGSLAGESLDALIQAIQENRAYVNIHTEQFGGGEIRGQIE
ncbi:MAG: CHRD domain-containing protein, partial [Planctomycetes bacterium]|nr:CHRD domain-containing protein [Planctomycetota bacterium]